MLNKQYWNNRYKNSQTGWDIGTVSSPLKAYFDQLVDKKLHILIPGCGNAHEAAYLYNNDFENVFVLDWSEEALKQFSERLPYFPKKQIVHGDFFEHLGKYDLIVEQTFFCALTPQLRFKYAQKMSNLLKNSGKLVGLLFNAPLNTTHPPFGGSPSEYRTYFAPHFNIITMDVCYNSNTPRAGRELFVKLIKK
ncbi:MAG: methyltransferase domain-containing protein [Chitinophagales bacterium]